MVRLGDAVDGGHILSPQYAPTASSKRAVAASAAVSNAQPLGLFGRLRDLVPSLASSAPPSHRHGSNVATIPVPNQVLRHRDALERNPKV